MKNIDILYEDADCVVLNKPAGLAVQGGDRITTSLDDLLAQEWQQRPFLVHRLDKDTSGLILVAKTKDAARYYSSVIGGKKAEKIYVALCNKRIEPLKGEIDDPLEIRGTEKRALTFYKTLAYSEHFSLLELRLGSGRMHQIRRHLALVGNPILGDDKYGDFALNRILKKERAVKKLMLHAWKLHFPSRLAQKTITVSAPLPEYFHAFVHEEFGDDIM